MWTRQELKERAKIAFKANYWRNVLVAFILGLLTTGYSVVSMTTNDGSEDPAATSDFLSRLTPGQAAALAGGSIVLIIICVLLDIFVFNPLQIGCYAFFKDNVKTHNTEVGIVTVGFNDYGRKFLTMLLMSLYVFFWSLLFIIPGIIKSYSYRMVPFLVQDHPELAPNEVITRSRAMMDGQKMDTFLLDLSFIGWFLLSCITLGLVGIFWTRPYFYNTNAALYRRLSGADAHDAAAAPIPPVPPVAPEEVVAVVEETK